MVQLLKQLPQIAAFAQIAESVCSATDGPAAGSACVFPFNYMGVIHYGCTTIDGDTRPWCITQTDGVGAWWGYCDTTCPVQGSEKTQFYW